MAIPPLQPLADHDLNASLHRPATPSDPPSEKDIYDAIQYSKAVETARIAVPPKATMQEVVAVHVYRSALLAAVGGQDTITRLLDEKFDEFSRNVAREGNREVIEKMDKLAEKVDGLTEKVDGLTKKVDGLTISLHNVHRQSAVALNMQRGDGRAIAFDGVPFLDGTLPTDATHSLPAIQSVDDLLGFSDARLRKFHTGYYGNRRNTRLTVEQLRNLVKGAIGCTADVV